MQSDMELKMVIRNGCGSSPDVLLPAGESVLVTGGAGFIGSHLACALVDRGARVAVLDNLQAGDWGNVGEARGLVQCIEADVRDADRMRAVVAEVKPDRVFHLAANASVPGSVSDPRYDFESNAAGTFNVLNACRHAGTVRRIVLASSGAVYGEPAGFPITEQSALAPISPYGAGKLCAETVARSMASSFGVPVTLARLFNTYGPRMPRFVVFDFLRKLQGNPQRLEIMGTGRQVRDLNYVTDAVAGLMLLGAEGAPGEAYNVASGVSHTVTEIAECLLDLLQLRGQAKLTYTGESWSGDAQRWEVDISRMRSLGYHPTVELRAGLQRVVDWFEQRFGKLPRGG